MWPSYLPVLNSTHLKNTPSGECDGYMSKVPMDAPLHVAIYVMGLKSDKQ